MALTLVRKPIARSFCRCLQDEANILRLSECLGCLPAGKVAPRDL